MPQPDRAVFRLPASALFIPVLLFFITTPLATAAPWLLALYALPGYAAVWVLTTRTVADPEAVTVHNHLRRHRLTWPELAGFEFRGPRWAIAVTTDGKRHRLPMVRPTDLHRVAAVSGGRMTLARDAIEKAEIATNDETTMVRSRGSDGASLH